MNSTIRSLYFLLSKNVPNNGHESYKTNGVKIKDFWNLNNISDSLKDKYIYDMVCIVYCIVDEWAT